MKTIEQKREGRRKKTAEFFSPDSLVNEMLDKLPKSVWEENKTFCDPACGNGQFLIWVLIRKLAKGHDPLDALKSIYGVDIMTDNIKECRYRLLKVIQVVGRQEITEDHIASVLQRIVRINPDKIPQGALQYDFSFKNKTSHKDVKRWMEYIHKDNVLDDVDLPVQDEMGFQPTNLVESDRFDEDGNFVG